MSYEPFHHPIWPRARGFSGWDIREVLLAIAAVLLLLAVAGGVAALVGVESADLTGESSLIALGFTAGMEALLVASVWFFAARRNGWRALGFRAVLDTDMPAVRTALLLCLATAFAYAIVIQSTGWVDQADPSPIFSEELGPAGVALSVFLAVVAAPFSEELFFRGFVLKGLQPRLGAGAAVVLASALFALAHIQLLSLLPIFLIGLILARLYLRTGSILASMLVHGVYNGLLVGLVYLAKLADVPG